MTLSWPSSRNSFHPAWLLLPLPPLLGILWATFNEFSRVHPALVLRLLLAGVVVVPVLWWRASPAGDRPRRIMKELRVQLPGFLLATLVPSLMTWGIEREWAVWMLFGYPFGCFLMGASAFGSEFEQRTLASLLAQPKSRGAVFREKMAVLAGLLFLATANLVLLLPPLASSGDQGSNGYEIILVALFAFCGGPLFSLLSRSTLAGLVFSVTVPPILYLAATLGLQGIARVRFPEEALPLEWTTWLLAGGIPVYLLTTLVLGWHQFRDLQLREGGAGGRAESKLHPLSLPLDLLLARIFPVASATGQLIRKELRLQVVPWLVASLMIGLWALWLGLRFVATSEEGLRILNEVGSLTLLAGLLGGLLVISTGAACIAEERELGTLEWQLTQPASLARQWRIKLGVTTAVSLGLGVALPGVLLRLGFGREELRNGWGEPELWPLLIYSGLLLFLLALSIYASSICRNTMRATAAAVGIGAGMAGIIGLIILFLGNHLDDRISRNPWESYLPMAPPAWAPTLEFNRVLAGSLAGVLAAVFLTTLVLLAGRNFRRLVVPSHQIFRQLAGLGIGLAVAITAAGLGNIQLTILQQRAWLAEQQQEVRKLLVAELRSHAPADARISHFYQHFGVPTNAAPEVLVEAILAVRGWTASSEVTQLLRSSPGVNPTLAVRYGLTPDISQTNSPSIKSDRTAPRR